MPDHIYDGFTEKAVRSFGPAIAEAQEIWPELVRKEAFREWAATMATLEVFDKRSRAAVLATLLPLISIGEEVSAEAALRNAELLFVSILESVKKQ